MSGVKDRSGRPIDEGGITGKLEGIAPETRKAHRALLEAFCCAQTERLQRTLAVRYGRTEAGPGPRNYLMPQNDHLNTRTLVSNAGRGSDDCQDTYAEVRGIIGYQGARCGDGQ